MKSGGGKQKGSGFERLICKQLSLYFSQGEREDLFWRSAMSGGRATLQLRKDVINKSQSGDISPISTAGILICEKYLIECKFYGDLQIDSGFLCNRGNLHKFWVDTKKAAKNYNKIPMLIAKQNRLPTLLLTDPLCDLFNDPHIHLLSWNAHLHLFADIMKIIPNLKKVKRLASTTS